jgi:hypothetical protein
LHLNHIERDAQPKRQSWHFRSAGGIGWGGEQLDLDEEKFPKAFLVVEGCKTEISFF